MKYISARTCIKFKEDITAKDRVLFILWVDAWELQYSNCSVVDTAIQLSEKHKQEVYRKWELETDVGWWANLQKENSI